MGAASSLKQDKMIMRIIHDEIDRPLDASDIDTPRGETAKHEVHRLRGLLLSRTMGEEAAVELKVAFDEFDTDGSGEVGVEELGRIIKRLGLNRTKQQIQEMVDKVDADGSGEVDFIEYCALLGVTIRGPEDMKDIEVGYDKPYGTVMFSEKENRFFYLEGDIDDLIAAAAEKAAKSTLSDDQLDMFRKAFDEFDADGSGEIDASELNHLVKELGLTRTEKEIAEMVAEVDEDSSGEISFDEFAVMLAEMMMEDNPEMMAVMNGSKKKAMEVKAQRKKDSGVLIMWN
jgi:calmodulin